MSSHDFTAIAKRYKDISIVQNSSADILLDLLDIKDQEGILDVGCGTGNITKRLYDKSKGLVIGIDPSIGMIDASRKNYRQEIDFEVSSAEDFSYSEKFDVIFCNSTFQWIKDVQKTIANFYHALKSGGRVGIQAPAKKSYCPNFIDAVNAVKNDIRCGSTYNDFIHPWFFLDSAQEYAELFIRQGFTVPFSEIQTIETFHSPEETYKIFASGAIAGYLNKSYYKNGFNDQYSADFQSIVMEEFVRQAKYDGKVKLIFNRIFLIAIKG